MATKKKNPAHAKEVKYTSQQKHEQAYKKKRKKKIQGYKKNGGSTYAGGGEIKSWVGEKESKGYPVYVRKSGYPTQTISFHKSKELAQKKADKLGGSTYAGGGEIYKEYLENEDANNVYANAILLAKNYGTNKQLKEIQNLEKGKPTIERAQKRHKIVNPLYEKMMEDIGGSTYAGGGEIKRVENDDEHGASAFLMGYEPYFEKDVNIARIDDESKTVKPTHGYYPNHPLSKKAKAWAKKNGYKYVFEQGGSTYAGGGVVGICPKECGGWGLNLKW